MDTHRKTQEEIHIYPFNQSNPCDIFLYK